MLKIDDRVYYTANGSDDTGTIDHIDAGLVRKYGVIWDDGSPSDLYLASQLSKVD